MSKTALTPREVEVLEHFAAGRTHKLAARRMGVSQHSVYRYSDRARKKLGTEDSTSAVVVAIALGVIDAQKIGRQLAPDLFPVSEGGYVA